MITLRLRRDYNFPYQLAACAIEREQVSIIRNEEALSSRIAPPRFVPSLESPTIPGLAGREYCQSDVPVRASMANTWLGPVT